MKVNTMIQSALCGSAASLGYNWIYNRAFLEKLSEEKSLVFQQANPDEYKKAKKAFYVYPFSKVGDYSVQGEILKWLYDGLANDHGFSADDYATLVYEKLKPGGVYRGWVESYAKQLIYNRMSEALKTDNQPIRIHDEQLVGFMPYLACKALDLSNNKAWKLAQVFTSNPVYFEFYAYFDALYEALKNGDKHTVLKDYARKVPEDFKDRFTAAVNNSTDTFIDEYVNTACHIQNALPLVYHILYTTNSYEEAIKKNTILGGASSDRGIILGFLLSALYKTPKQWSDKLSIE